MCSTCDTAAANVATNYGGTIDADEVRSIVRAFREESERLIEAEETAGPGPDIEQDPTAPDILTFAEALGAMAVTMYPLGVRPYVLIEAEQLSDSPDADGMTHIAITAVMGGGIGNEAALEVMEKAVEQVKAAKG